MSDEHPPLSFFNDKAKNYDKWYSGSDWDSLLPMHTEEILLISGGNPPAKGKEALKKLFIGMKESMGPHRLSHTFDDYLLSGDAAVCRGHFTLKDESDKLLGSGNTIVVYKRENGKWLIHYDMFAM